MHCNFIWNNIQEERNKRPLRFFSRHWFEDGWPLIPSMRCRHRKRLDRRFPLTLAANGILWGHLSESHIHHHSIALNTGLSQSIKAAFYRLSLESTKGGNGVFVVCVRGVRVGVEVTCSYIYAGCTSWSSLRVRCAHSTVEMPEAISLLLLSIHPQFTMALFNRRLAGVRNCLSLSL